MKKYFLNFCAIALCLILISWGFKGHRITAMIAENHLTPQARAAVKQILGNESLADVSTWADEIKSDSLYRQTAAWHFLNLPLGLSYQDFVKAVNSQSKENIASAIQKAEVTLSDPKSSLADKREALKFVIHLVGDAHQPMHVSRAEDKGGNTIQVRFDGKGTNLHSLWDSKLIDHEGLSETNLVKQLEAGIKPGDVSILQADKPSKWLYESYSAATTIYSDVAKDNSISEEQYKRYIKVVHERLISGGIRLAGVLNSIFATGQISEQAIGMTEDTTNHTADERVNFINIEKVGLFINKLVTLNAEVYSSKDVGNMVLLNLGAEYPNQLLTVVLKGAAKSQAKNISDKITSENPIDKIIHITGKVIIYKDKPEIIITDPNKIGLGIIVGDNTANGRKGG